MLTSQNFSYVRKVFQRKFTPLHETFFASEAPGRPKPKTYLVSSLLQQIQMVMSMLMLSFNFKVTSLSSLSRV